ncbi:MAG: AAA family ATPase, partial [Nostocales cyanobacterium W4_Combined_metabat2_030]|nr:AAA family ATPase [Nostocales cyanobacterium W4_Combined_metabat2_030]
MIKNIRIQNFRYFEVLKISGFDKINLISGKNNIGKTALLEALFLNSTPRPDTIFLLRQVRRESSKFRQSLPENT